MRDGLRCQPRNEGTPALHTLIEAGRAAPGFERNIAPILTDIDSSIKRIRHDRAPARVRGFPPRNCSRQSNGAGRLSFARAQTPQSNTRAAQRRRHALATTAPEYDHLRPPLGKPITRAIQKAARAVLDCFASLAMTNS